MIDGHGVVKICDFGEAAQFSTSQPYLMEVRGTYRFMSPEMLLRIGYTSKTDIWVSVFLNILRASSQKLSLGFSSRSFVRDLI